MTIEEYKQKLKSRIEHFKETPITDASAITLLELEYVLNLVDELSFTEESVEPENSSFMTNLELATLLAKGYGQVSVLPTDQDGDYATFETHWTYFDEEGGRDDDKVSSSVRIREFGTQKWIEPTTEVFEGFMGRLPYPFYVH